MPYFKSINERKSFNVVFQSKFFEYSNRKHTPFDYSCKSVQSDYQSGHTPGNQGTWICIWQAFVLFGQHVNTLLLASSYPQFALNSAPLALNRREPYSIHSWPGAWDCPAPACSFRDLCSSSCAAYIRTKSAVYIINTFELWSLFYVTFGEMPPTEAEPAESGPKALALALFWP